MTKASYSNEDLTGYEIVLNEFIASLFPKKKSDDSVDEAEFKAIIKTVFIKSVIQFCDESKLYILDIPVDFYECVKSYGINTPAGFLPVSVIEIISGKYQVSKNIRYDKKTLLLPVAPKMNTSKAVYVRMSIKPNRSCCEFDSEFIDGHYDTIVLLMSHHLHMMDQRMWADLGRADRYYARYAKSLKAARSNNSSTTGAITRQGYSLTDARHSYQR